MYTRMLILFFLLRLDIAWLLLAQSRKRNQINRTMPYFLRPYTRCEAVFWDFFPSVTCIMIVCILVREMTLAVIAKTRAMAASREIQEVRRKENHRTCRFFPEKSLIEQQEELHQVVLLQKTQVTRRKGFQLK
jgi:hypothetical protein